jgi:hypothetical protein
MGLQAYFVFSIGNIHPILAASRPACMVNYTACPEGLVTSETYIQVIPTSHDDVVAIWLEMPVIWTPHDLFPKHFPMLDLHGLLPEPFGVRGQRRRLAEAAEGNI